MLLYLRKALAARGKDMEEIYNRSKAFIYKDGQSPYQVVLANIQRLLDAGVM